ncbi:hypothetical protein F66182_2600 [Fusarium sp. NRRL 66182]|nr:hypothetical protein F66182_2600 [Fusarium sp. NRRL 66182]
MTFTRQSLLSLRHLPPAASALRARSHLLNGPHVSLRMNSGKVKTPASSDPKHGNSKQAASDLADGATTSLKATPGKQNAGSFETQNLTEKEKKTNSQNAQESDSREGIEGEAGTFTKSGRTHKI